MPRHPDPDLEERVLKAAEGLWRRGGARALTMRAVARAAGTNTPAVYRRFKDRQDLIRGILLRVGDRIRQDFQRRRTLEEMADAYIDFALDNPNDYQLFYTEARLLNPPRKRDVPVAAIRQSRPNFGFVEQVAAEELGGAPEDHTQFALALWSIVHGAAMLLLSNNIPPGHEEALREACRAGVRALIDQARVSRQNGKRRS
jgi:AcrR family transcriptional regulator